MIRLLAVFLMATGCAGEPTYSEVRDDVFLPSCGLGSTCHEGGAGDFDVDASADIYGQLVGVPASDAEGETRVIAGDSAGSYLIKKLQGDEGIEGDPMPPPAGLDATRIQLVADWIDAGALDN